MTDRQLLELLVEKVTGMENRMDSMENRMGSFETELKDFRTEANTKLDNLQTQSDMLAIHVLKHSDQLRLLIKRPV